MAIDIQRTLLSLSTNSAFYVIEGADHGSIQSDERYAAQVRPIIQRVIEARRAPERVLLYLIINCSDSISFMGSVLSSAQRVA